jgi:hypothetical protein
MRKNDLSAQALQKPFFSLPLIFFCSFLKSLDNEQRKIKKSFKKSFCSAFSFLFLIFVISFIISSNVYAKDITVDDDGSADFKKIQDAINSAQSGDVIKVKAGVYNENIVLKSGVSLKGEGYENTRIEYTGEGAVIYGKVVESGRIEGFTISYKYLWIMPVEITT